MHGVTDHTTPGDRWAFNQDVADAFPDMLARSIPQYADMRRLVTDLAVHFAQPGTDVVDIGCSRGDALEPIVRRLGPANRYVGLDVAEPMLAAAREAFGPLVDVRSHDLRAGLPADVDPSVVLSVLTIQFTPIEYRQQIVRSIHDRLRPGGALLLVEKVLGETAVTDDLFTDMYYRLKSANGYDAQAIAQKRRSLEGVLVPVTARWNEQLLRSAGFRVVDCVWRWCNFAAWVAVRDRAEVIR